ncbi:MAG: phage gp6-like head-tail connector protein [Firmicutes bacterium]|nr:phage gp6-like head-tail connector protein [Bacillota bacterium]
MLSTLDRAKKHCGVFDTAQDDYVMLLLSAASDACESYCRRSFRKQSYTEITGAKDGSKYLVLRNYPILSVEQVTLDSGDITDYEFSSDNSGMLYRSTGWPCGPRTVNVTYTAGYVLPGEETPEESLTLPAAIELACLMLVKQMFTEQIHTETERLGDYSAKYRAGNTLPAAVESLLNPYVGRWV